jgi:hypothetical protein
MRDDDVDLPDPGLALHFAALRERLSVVDPAASGARLPARTERRSHALHRTTTLRFDARVTKLFLDQLFVFRLVRMNRPAILLNGTASGVSGLTQIPFSALLRGHAVIHG